MAVTAMKKQQKILLLEGIHSVAINTLEEQGFLVDTLDHSLAGAELIEKAKGYDGLGIRSKTKLNSEVLKAMDSLAVVGCFCIGTNQVDLDSANYLGMPVFNAPYSNTRSVAELVIAEMVALSRRLGDLSRLAHEGVWQKSAKGSNEVRGKTLGIVGYGHIGTQVSVMAEAMGLNVIYYDILTQMPMGNANPVNSLDELLAQSHFVTLHVPETPDTKNMMGDAQIKKMNKGSYLINASRGSVVDILALAAAIESGHIAGAAVDVYPKEPASNKEKFVSELQGLPNVILTPHIGGSTEEAQEKIGAEVADSLIKFFGMGSTSGAVNFPNIEAYRLGEAPRIVNTHRNVPGVLGALNSIVSGLGGNILTQQLATNQDIGYLVMDLGGCDAVKAAQMVGELKTSVKTRLISL